MEWLSLSNAAYLAAILIGGYMSMVAVKWRPILKEFKDVAYRIDKFGECAEIIKVDENYKFFINKSPKNKSYEHYSDKTYVNQAEKMSISWLGKEVDKCSTHIREAKYSSPMAQEFILIPQRLVVQQLFLLASLDNKEITWGQYNRKTEEIDNFAEKKTSDFVERMKLPGAVMSGFWRPSSVGPRLEKAANPSELFAIRSELIGSLGYFEGHHPPHSEVIDGR